MANVVVKVTLEIDVPLVEGTTLEGGIEFAKSLKHSDLVTLKNKKNSYNDFTTEVIGIWK